MDIFPPYLPRPRSTLSRLPVVRRQLAWRLSELVYR